MGTRARCERQRISVFYCNHAQFAEEFRDQFTAERLEYMDEIEHTIRNSVDERYIKGQGPSGHSRAAAIRILTSFMWSSGHMLM
jgi:hypothetical protein